MLFISFHLIQEEFCTIFRNDSISKIKSMKKQTSFFILSLFISVTTLVAQPKTPEKTVLPNDVSVVNAQLDVFKNNVNNQIQIIDLQVEQYDKISILDKQGTVLLKKTVKSGIADMDVSHLDEGVYLLGLWSSANMKEKTIKFIIRR